MIGAKKNAVSSVRWSLYCFEIPASPWFSFANSDRSGNPICSDISQIQLDSFVIFCKTMMTSLTCRFISIVVWNPCGSSSFPAYRGSALVKTVLSSLLPLVCICFSYSWHLLLSRLGFSTKPQRQCLHFTRVCGLCHHPSLSNSGNVSGHHLADGFWSSFVRFVASFSSVQFCHPCHLSSYSHWLCPLIWTWTQLCFRVHSPPLAGSSTTVHSSLILQNAPPCYACPPLSARQEASIQAPLWWSLLRRLVMLSVFHMPSPPDLPICRF